ATLVDVGTGTGDLAASARAVAAAHGVALTTIGVDVIHALLVGAPHELKLGVAADACHLPFRDRSVDVVLCSQTAHHFFGADLRALIAELDRVARHGVIVADLRRSWIAAAGFWLAAVVFRFQPITR